MQNSESWRSFRVAAWLGWQLETNWASPWLFALYMLVKPVCGSLMLVCMFHAADHVGLSTVAFSACLRAEASLPSAR